jgi:ferrous iron transport protein A
MRLDELRPGQSATIKNIEGSGAFRQRLISMGVTPGTWLMVRKFAPLGDPIEIRIRNYSLSIRKKDAHAITVILEEDNL